MLTYAAKSDLGHDRENNEDQFLALPEQMVWVLADGVGGQDAGEVASELVCKRIGDELSANHSLESAIQLAHDDILNAPSQGVGKPGMASTVVALQVHDHAYQISWVGDSRAYLWGHDRLVQISRDQSLVQRLVDEGVISVDEAFDHPRRNMLLQAIGQENIDKLEIDSVRADFEEGDKIILCSDGLSDYVSEESIVEILNSSNDDQVLVDALVAKALENQGKDNITVVVVSLSRKAVHHTQLMSSGALNNEMMRQERWAAMIKWAPALLIVLLLLFWLFSSLGGG